MVSSLNAFEGVLKVAEESNKNKKTAGTTVIACRKDIETSSCGFFFVFLCFQLLTMVK